MLDGAGFKSFRGMSRDSPKFTWCQAKTIPSSDSSSGHQLVRALLRNFYGQAFIIRLPLGIQHKPHKSERSWQLEDGNTCCPTFEQLQKGTNMISTSNNIQQDHLSMHTRFVSFFSGDTSGCVDLSATVTAWSHPQLWMTSWLPSINLGDYINRTYTY